MSAVDHNSIDHEFLYKIETNYPYILKFIKDKAGDGYKFHHILYLWEHLIVLESHDNISYYEFFNVRSDTYPDLLDKTYEWIENNEALIQLRML